MAHQHASSQDLGSPGLLLGEQRISRRTILRKLAGLTLAEVSIASFATSCGYHTTFTPAAGPAVTPRLQCDSNGCSENRWNSSRWAELYTYRGHSASVNAVAWSPDGTRIASGSADFSVQLWDAANGGHALTYRGHADHVNTVAWSPDGKRIASGGDDDTAHGWDAPNVVPILPHTPPLIS